MYEHHGVIIIVELQQSVTMRLLFFVGVDCRKCDDSLLEIGWLTKLQTGDV